MNPQQIAHLDRSILQVFEAMDCRFGLGVEAVRPALIPYGFEVDTDLVQTRIEKLERVNRFLERVEKDMNRALKTWRITADGIQWLEDNGYA